MYGNILKTILNDYDGYIQTLIIPYEETNGTGICNSSLFVEDDTIHLIMRHVEYTLYHAENEQKYQSAWEGPLAYYHREDCRTLKTNNFYCILNNKDLSIDKYYKIDTTKLDDEPKWDFVGLEDARLVKWDDKYYLCGVRRDTTTNGQGRMEISEIEITTGKVNEIKRVRIEVENEDSYCEKNWMPIIDKPFHFVRWVNPLEIVRFDMEQNKCENVYLNDLNENNPSNIRGGTPLIKWFGDKYLCITHDVDYICNNHNGHKDSDYYHRFIIFNNDYSIFKISDQFNFMTAKIEFCIGLTQYKDDILISFGYQDNSSYIIKINKYKLQSFINEKLDHNPYDPTEEQINSMECITERISEITDDSVATTIEYSESRKYLCDFINEPYNDINNFELGYSYEMIGQTASALSYYLRCAEFTKDEDLAYECLLRMSLCLSKQGTRDIMELTCIQHAVSIKPERPEGNYLMSIYYSYRNKWLESYMFACNGLKSEKSNHKLRKDFIYTDFYQLEFQKAYSGYNKGKLHESKKIYYKLLSNENVNNHFREIIQNNLDIYPDLLKIEKEKKIINNYNKIGIDVGACIGETLNLFDNCDLVYAFEPLKEEFNILKEKVLGDGRIIPINCAISDENGEQNLKCYENGRFSSFLDFNKESDFYDFCSKNVESFDNLKSIIPVKTVRLDDFMKENNITTIEYLKIDTQGTDLKVIKSLGNYLSNVKTIQTEVQLKELYKGSTSKEELMEFMEANSFKLINKTYGEISKEYEQDFIFENNKKEKEKEKIDIVLQGKYNDNVLLISEYYLELDFVNNIIVSCWEDDNVPSINNRNITVIKNKQPNNPGTGQRNLQIVSSLNGIKKTTTKYIVKIRNDQRYTHDSFIKMYDFYEKNKVKKASFYYDDKKPYNRICVSGNFSEFSFHPRDHLFWGHKEDLIDLFSLPLEYGKLTDKVKFIQPEDYSLYYDYFIRTETYIGAHYISNFNRMTNYYLLSPEKYLYDNSEMYHESKKLSDELTPKIFKSFPRTGIDLEWYKYGWKTYPYDIQRERFKERWDEAGL